MENLLIIDVQFHYTQKETEEYIKRLIQYIKINKNKIKSITIVIDRMHDETSEPAGFNSFRDEGKSKEIHKFIEDMTEFTNGYCGYEELFETIEYFNEKAPHLINKLEEYIIKDRLPLELAKFLLIIEEKGKKVNKIEKWFGGIRELIDCEIKSLPYFTKLAFELNNLKINHSNLTYTELEEIIEENQVIKKIISNIKTSIGLDIYEITTKLTEGMTLSTSFEIEKYENLVKEGIPIKGVGGAMMECFIEESICLLSVADAINQKIDYSIEPDLLYGSVKHIEYEWLKELTGPEMVISEINEFNRQYKIFNKKDKTNTIKLPRPKGTMYS